MRQPGEFQINPGASEAGGFVIAMYAGDYVGLAKDHDSYGGGEDDDVGDGVVVPLEVDSDAGEVPLPFVAAGCDVLSDEGVSDVSFVAALDEDSVGGEMSDVAVVDTDSERVDDEDASAMEV